MGVIDTLTAGFDTVVRRPWLLLVPVLLDLALLLAPKVSVAPVYDAISVALEREQAIAQEEVVGAVGEQLEFLRSVAEETNLLSLLSVNRLLLPSIAALRPIDPESDRVIPIADPIRALLVVLVSVGVGLFIACAYLTLLAQQTRGHRNNLAQLGRLVPLFWLRTLGVLGIVFLFGVSLAGLGIVVALVAQVAVLLGVPGLAQGLTGVFFFAIWMALLWLSFYLFFVPQALTLAEASPLTAVKQSFIVVRSSFWRSLGLVILVNVISTGLGFLWGAMMSSSAGTVAAIVANAFVGTGLIAAVFIYFRERVIAIHQAQLRLRQGA